MDSIGSLPQRLCQRVSDVQTVVSDLDPIHCLDVLRFETIVFTFDNQLLCFQDF